MDRVFRTIVIAVLLMLTLGFGLCSALGLGVGSIAWMQSLGKDAGHAHAADYSGIYFFFSVPGLLVAVVCGWLARGLWRRRPNTSGQ